MFLRIIGKFNFNREIKDSNRKFLYTIQKEFLKFVAPENPLGLGLEIEDDEELGDEGIDLKTLKKNSKEW